MCTRCGAKLRSAGGVGKGHPWSASTCPALLPKAVWPGISIPSGVEVAAGKAGTWEHCCGAAQCLSLSVGDRMGTRGVRAGVSPWDC